MNILHVIRDLDPGTGGPVEALRGLTRAQARAGHSVTIITSTDVVTVTPDFPRRPSVGHSGWGWSWDLAGRMRAEVERADVVHGHMVWDYAVLAAARTCQKLERPFILRPCGQLAEWSLDQRSVKKTLYLRAFPVLIEAASAVHFTTDRERQSSYAAVGGKPAFVAPLGVGDEFVECYDEGPASGKPYDTAGKRTVLFLGRLHFKKQPEALIAAMGMVAKRVPDARLVLAGAGEADYVAGLQALCKTHGIEDRVAFVGLLTGKARIDAFRAADLFVLPSLHENFGLAAVEAMAAGCPVLISRNVDVSDDIAAASAGVICDADPNAIAGGIMRIIDDKEAAGAMAKRARALVDERYNWEEIAKRVVALYRELGGQGEPSETVLSGRH